MHAHHFRVLCVCGSDAAAIIRAVAVTSPGNGASEQALAAKRLASRWRRRAITTKISAARRALRHARPHDQGIGRRQQLQRRPNRRRLRRVARAPRAARGHHVCTMRSGRCTSTTRTSIARARQLPPFLVYEEPSARSVVISAPTTRLCLLGKSMAEKPPSRRVTGSGSGSGGNPLPLDAAARPRRPCAVAGVAVRARTADASTTMAPAAAAPSGMAAAGRGAQDGRPPRPARQVSRTVASARAADRPPRSGTREPTAGGRLPARCSTACRGTSSASMDRVLTARVAALRAAPRRSKRPGRALAPLEQFGRDVLPKPHSMELCGVAFYQRNGLFAPLDAARNHSSLQGSRAVLCENNVACLSRRRHQGPHSRATDMVRGGAPEARLLRSSSGLQPLADGRAACRATRARSVASLSRSTPCAGGVLCRIIGRRSATCNRNAEQRAQLVLSEAQPRRPGDHDRTEERRVAASVSHERCLVEEAEQRVARQRSACVADKGTSELARRLDSRRALAELTVRVGVARARAIARGSSRG